MLFNSKEKGERVVSLLSAKQILKISLSLTEEIVFVISNFPLLLGAKQAQEGSFSSAVMKNQE